MQRNGERKTREEPAGPVCQGGRCRPARFTSVLLFALVLWGTGYGLRDIATPDEPRYAYVAKEMRTSGNWSMPQRNGEYYAHKPPLMFWLINLSSTLTGGEITSTSLRLPSLLGTVLSLWFTAQLAAMWYGPAAAWRSILVLSSTVLFWQQGSVGQIDALLCGLQMAALFFLFRSNAAPAAWRWALAYAFMGLAILAKGPVGLVVPLGVYICATWAAGEKAALRKSHWGWGPPIALLFPAAWLAWAWLEGAPPSFFSEVLFSQSLDRVAGTLGHPRPFYFFLLSFPVNALPWTLFLPAACMVARLRPDMARPRARLLAWLLFVIVFFSIPSCKRGLYVLLACPAVSILIAAAWNDLSRRVGTVTVYAIPVLLCALGLAVVGTAFWWPLPINGLLLLPNAAVLLGGAVGAIHLSRRDGLSSAWLYWFSGVVLITLLCISTLVYPALNHRNTPVELAEATHGMLTGDQKLLLYQMDGEIYALYCGVDGKRIDTVQQLRLEVEKHGQALVVARTNAWEEIRAGLGGDPTPNPFTVQSKSLVWSLLTAAPGRTDS